MRSILALLVESQSQNEGPQAWKSAGAWLGVTGSPGWVRKVWWMPPSSGTMTLCPQTTSAGPKDVATCISGLCESWTQEPECERQMENALYSTDLEMNCHRLRSSEVVSGLNLPLVWKEKWVKKTLIMYQHHRGPCVSVYLPSCFLRAIELMSQMHAAPSQKQEGSRLAGGLGRNMDSRGAVAKSQFTFSPWVPFGAN